MNRSDAAALALAGSDAPEGIEIDGREVRKLLGTVWFRDVVPRLSEAWRQRVLDVLIGSTAIPNHLIKVDRRDRRLGGLSYEELCDLVRRVAVPDAARADIDLLISVGRLWGEEAMRRFEFVAVTAADERSGLAGLLHGLRTQPR